MEKAYRSLGGRIEFIGVNLGDREKIVGYMEKHGLSLPVAYDEGKKVASSFNAKTPMYIIVDLDGTVIYKEASPPEDIEGYLQKLFGERIE